MYALVIFSFCLYGIFMLVRVFVICPLEIIIIIYLFKGCYIKNKMREKLIINLCLKRSKCVQKGYSDLLPAEPVSLLMKGGSTEVHRTMLARQKRTHASERPRRKHYGPLSLLVALEACVVSRDNFNTTTTQTL